MSDSRIQNGSSNTLVACWSQSRNCKDTRCLVYSCTDHQLHRGFGLCTIVRVQSWSAWEFSLYVSFFLGLVDKNGHDEKMHPSSIATVWVICVLQLLSHLASNVRMVMCVKAMSHLSSERLVSLIVLYPWPLIPSLAVLLEHRYCQVAFMFYMLIKWVVLRCVNAMPESKVISSITQRFMTTKVVPT